jgi:hypothetical protein
MAKHFLKHQLCSKFLLLTILGVKESSDTVKLVVWIDGTKYEYNMIAESCNIYSKTLTFSGVKGTIHYYYFVAKDKADNTKVYSPNGDGYELCTLPLNVTDQTPPKTTIYKIKILQNYTLVELITT